MYKYIITVIVSLLLLTSNTYTVNGQDINSEERHNHELYSVGCCNGVNEGGDCHEIKSCDELTELPDGGYKWRHYYFGKLGVNPSKNNKCHVCIGNEGKGRQYEQPRCVYIQQGT